MGRALYKLFSLVSLGVLAYSPAIADEVRPRSFEVIAHALREGSPSSLSVLKPDQLKTLPNYQSELLPFLKAELLKHLVSQFTDREWREWPQLLSSMTNPSQAREFVDRINMVNIKLGVYLETAAQLFHGLFLAIEKGGDYSVTENFEYLKTHAEEILAYRGKTPLPPQFMFSEEVIRDEVFIGELNRLRAELVARFIRANPRQWPVHLSLINALPEHGIAEDVYQAIGGSLASLVLDGDSATRQIFLYQELRIGKLQRYAAISPIVRRSLAQLFVIGAVDALERGESMDSGKFLTLSTTLEPGLRVQTMVSKYLQARSGDSEALERLMTKATATGATTQGEMLSRPDEGGVVTETGDDEISVGKLGVLFVLCCAVPLVTFFLFHYVNKRNERQLRESRSIPSTVINNDLHSALRPHDLAMETQALPKVVGQGE